MNNKKLIHTVLSAIIAIALIVLPIKVVSGTFALLSGAVNAVVAIVVILALVVIVVWMFRYASKH